MPESLVLPRRQVALGAALTGLAAAVVPALGQGSSDDAKSLETLKAMLDSYEKDFTAHNLAGVLAIFAPNAVIVGTGPGEIWGGPAEIGETYKRFFSLFDVGKQQHESLFRDGHVLGDMAWIVAMSKVALTKGANTTEFGLNSSVVFERIGGKWLVRAMHISNITTAQPAAQ